MDSFVALAVLIALFVLIAPILGLVAFFQMGGLRRDLAGVQTELMALRRRVMSGDDAAPTVGQPPDVSPAAAPMPAAAAPPQQIGPDTALPEQPQSAPQTRPRPVKARKPIDWERMIAANWAVWAGGLALAVGGLFLVRVAVDAGFFGPLARTLSAVVLGGGLIWSAFRAGRSKLVGTSENSIRYLPPILSGAGVVSLYGAALAAGILYGLVPPLIALALLVVVSLIAIVLSLRFGPLLAGLGLSGAYIAPFLTGAPDGSALPLLPYAAVITAAGFALIRLKDWAFLAILTLCGAGLWGLIGVGVTGVASGWAAPVYAIVIGVLGLVFGAAHAQRAIALPESWEGIVATARGFPLMLAATYAFWALAGGLILLKGFEDGGGYGVVSALAAYGGIGLFASWQRPGYSFITPLSAIVTVCALLVWTRIAPGLAYACFAAAIGYGVASTAVMSQMRFKAPVAVTAALVPPAVIFIAFWRHNALEPNFYWALGTLLAACIMGAVLDAMQRTDRGFKLHPGAAAAYALGAVLCAVLAPFLVFSGLWLGPAVAIAALAVGLIYLRFELPLLRFGILAAVALATGLMVRPGMLSGVVISPTPILNELTLGFGLSIAALFAGSKLMGGHPQARRAYEGGALVLLFSLIGLTIRHIAGGGILTGPFAGLGEASGYAIAYIGMAASLALRLRSRALLWRVVEYVALALGCVGVMMAFVALNGEPLGHLPIVNLLFPAFAMPAILLAAYGVGLRRRMQPLQANFASLAAIALGFAWVTFETTFMLTGEALGAPRDGLWAYSATWIAYAFALLFWGVWRTRLTARYASLGILILSIAKVFLVDMSALSGLARAGSFIGLGFALIGVALFYQRYVFGVQKTAVDDSGSHS